MQEPRRGTEKERLTKDLDFKSSQAGQLGDTIAHQAPVRAPCSLGAAWMANVLVAKDGVESLGRNQE